MICARQAVLPFILIALAACDGGNEKDIWKSYDYLTPLPATGSVTSYPYLKPYNRDVDWQDNDATYIQPNPGWRY